jgi:ribonuclease-3
VSDFLQLEKNLGLRFKNIDLLKQAFTHRSYLNENPSWQHPHNERLEFLGDAALELAVTEFLYREFPNPEGELTAFRAALVNAERLSGVANELDLGKHLLLSRGEAKEFGRSRQDILANTFEALVGAIYLDQGFAATREFLEKALFWRIKSIIAQGSWRDPKSRFQEISQERVGITPEYRVIKEWGPDHDKRFLVAVCLGNEEVAPGEGASKQEAEMRAASKALEIKNW